MLQEKLKHLKNSVNWRTTQLKYKVDLIDYYVKYHELKKALKTIDETHQKLNIMQQVINKLIQDLHIQLEVRRKQICQQP
ncbi:MAG: hypothetical protein QXU09_04830 [Thermoproteota archaeon]